MSFVFMRVPGCSDKKLAQNKVKSQRTLRDLLLKIQDSIATWESGVKSENSQGKLPGHAGGFFLELNVKLENLPEQSDAPMIDAGAAAARTSSLSSRVAELKHQVHDMRKTASATRRSDAQVSGLQAERARLKTKSELLEKIERAERMTVLTGELAKIERALRISSD
jgi:sigma54-dependent transcription regulator